MQEAKVAASSSSSQADANEVDATASAEGKRKAEVGKLHEELKGEELTVEELEEKYGQAHKGSGDVHELTATALNKMNDEQKKASLASIREQQSMSSYLKFKKKELQAKDAAEARNQDPETSSTYTQYLEQAERYLAEYKTHQEEVKNAKESAELEKSRYNQLQSQQKQLALDTQSLKLKLTAAGREFNATTGALLHQEQELNKASQHAQDLESHLKSDQWDARHAKMSYKQLKVEEKRVHKKWVELNKQETYFGALRIEAAEAVTRLSSIMMKLNQDAQEIQFNVDKQRELKALYVEKFNASDAAQAAFSGAFKDRGCGLLPHQIAEIKAREARMENLLSSAQEASEVAYTKFSELQALEGEGTSKAATTQQGKATQMQDILLSQTVALVDVGVGGRNSALEAPGAPMATSKDASENAECEYDRQMGEMNYNAAQQAKALMERHMKQELKYQAEKDRMLDAGDGDKTALEDAEAKAEEYQAKETQAIKLSEEPCGELSFEEEWNAGNPNSK